MANEIGWICLSARSDFCTVTVIVSMLLMVIVSADIIHSLYFHPLAKFPGPMFAAVSRLPFAFSAVTGSTYKWLDRLHAQYGEVVRISPGELSTISPGAWKDIYLTRPQLKKDPYSQTPPLNGAHSLFTAHGATHARIRRLYVNAFTDKALKEQNPIIESHVQLLMQRMRRDITRADNNVIDIAKYYGYAALDIIADLTFGESFHGLEGENEHHMIVGIFLGAKFGAIRNSLSHFYPLDRLFGMIFLRLTARKRKQNYEFNEKAINKRLAMGDLGFQRQDFMSALIGNVNPGKEKGITRTELDSNSLAIIIAGCQLTTVALATATYLLLRNPVTYQCLRDEIRQTFLDEKEIDITKTQSLPYLSAVIDETLRIHHPTPINLPRIVPAGGLTIDGTWIPEKTVIGIALQTSQTTPLYWEDALGFHPERFLSPNDGRYESRFNKDNKDAFHPFSMGNRNCLGGKVFLAEAKVILAKTIFAFDLSLSNHVANDWMDQKAFLVFEPSELLVQVREKQVL
ncbi:cytochrome P450 [Truncatella angustata]|uniref:Cytochrome P450 n=1 Tax=Truncatella angustata TaxID=152316 RepID=A0A9P8UBJ6_9PEZI|nr:cytochrome P450 [Truncatella angustata]KAH6646157.1 cytochrome P450 [Truncatella angustata]